MNNDKTKLIMICIAIAAIVMLMCTVSLNTQQNKVIPLDKDCPDDGCVTWLDSNDLYAGSNDLAMDIPVELRRANRDGGSCVHVSNENLLIWQGMYQTAQWWASQYKGGEYSGRLISRLEAAGLRFAYTQTGDEKFLEWTVRTRRGAGLFYKPSHSINLVHLDKDYAYLLDNNNRKEIEKVPRDTFMRKWKHDFGGFAWTLVFVPAPPLPIH